MFHGDFKRQIMKQPWTKKLGNKVHGLFQSPSCHENNREIRQYTRVSRVLARFHGNKGV